MIAAGCFSEVLNTNVNFTHLRWELFIWSWCVQIDNKCYLNDYRDTHSKGRKCEEYK